MGTEQLGKAKGHKGIVRGSCGAARRVSYWTVKRPGGLRIDGAQNFGKRSLNISTVVIPGRNVIAALS